MSFHCTLFRSLVFSIRVSSGSTEWMLHFINSPCLNESLASFCGVFADSAATRLKAGGNVIETHEHTHNFGGLRPSRKFVANPLWHTRLAPPQPSDLVNRFVGCPVSA